MKTSDFDYCFPKEAIAHEPAKKRDHSRLMVLERETRRIRHRTFSDIADYLGPGDLLVLNDTRVIPANMTGKKADGGGRVEVLLAKKISEKVWECLVRPGKRLQVGSEVVFGSKLRGKVLEKRASGEQIIEFAGALDEFMHKHGEIPLPPYIKSNKQLNKSQLNNTKKRKAQLFGRYQTVYAAKEGASAAPTAGLHFTAELIRKIKKKGAATAYLTLHTGLGTFMPVRTEHVEEHAIHSEYFEIPKATIAAIKKAKRVIAVGTTSVRALESIFNSPPLSPSLNKRGGKQPEAAGGELRGDTKLFIYPGYKFKVVDAMITNFHWPRSTLIMLVSAFAGKEFIMEAYREAIKEKYRFFSFGDAMLIL